MFATIVSRARGMSRRRFRSHAVHVDGGRTESHGCGSCSRSCHRIIRNVHCKKALSAVVRLRLRQSTFQRGIGSPSREVHAHVGTADPTVCVGLHPAVTGPEGGDGTMCRAVVALVVVLAATLVPYCAGSRAHTYPAVDVTFGSLVTHNASVAVPSCVVLGRNSSSVRPCVTSLQAAFDLAAQNATVRILTPWHVWEEARASNTTLASEVVEPPVDATTTLVGPGNGDLYANSSVTLVCSGGTGQCILDGQYMRSFLHVECVRCPRPH